MQIPIQVPLSETDFRMEGVTNELALLRCKNQPVADRVIVADGTHAQIVNLIGETENPDAVRSLNDKLAASNADRVFWYKEQLGGELLPGELVTGSGAAPSSAAGNRQIKSSYKANFRDWGYTRFDQVRLTSHRLLLHNKKSCLFDGESHSKSEFAFPRELHGNHGLKVRDANSWFCLRLDRIDVGSVRLRGSGILRAKKLVFNYVPLITIGNPPRSVDAPFRHELSFRFDTTELARDLQELLLQFLQMREWTRGPGGQFLQDVPHGKSAASPSPSGTADSGATPLSSSGGTMGGLGAIRARAQEKLEAEAALSDEGLADIRSLQKHAQQLLALAKKVSASGSGDADGEDGDSEGGEIRKLLKQYGIMGGGGDAEDDGAALDDENGDDGAAAKPTTTTQTATERMQAEISRKQAVKKKREEKVREWLAQGEQAVSPENVCKLCEETLPRQSGMMLVHDIYTLFNRLRGLDIVSPADLMQSLRMACSDEYWEQKDRDGGGPLRLRKLKNGARVVQLKSLVGSQDDVEKKILKAIDEDGAERSRAEEDGSSSAPSSSFGINPVLAGRVSAAELAEKWNVSISLAVLELAEAERTEASAKSPSDEAEEPEAVICRDDSLEGLFYYKVAGSGFDQFHVPSTH